MLNLTFDFKPLFIYIARQNTSTDNYPTVGILSCVNGQNTAVSFGGQISGSVQSLQITFNENTINWWYKYKYQLEPWAQLNASGTYTYIVIG